MRCDVFEFLILHSLVVILAVSDLFKRKRTYVKTAITRQHVLPTFKFIEIVTMATSLSAANIVPNVSVMDQVSTGSASTCQVDMLLISCTSNT